MVDRAGALIDSITPDITADDVRAVLTGLEEAALGYGEEYGHCFASVDDAVKWVLAADGEEPLEEASQQFAAYLRLRAAVQRTGA